MEHLFRTQQMKPITCLPSLTTVGNECNPFKKFNERFNFFLGKRRGRNIKNTFLFKTDLYVEI